jgi:hypothetical protein
MAQQTADAERTCGVGARCSRGAGLEGAVRWQLDPVKQECRFVTLLARLNESNDSFLDFHVLPGINRKTRFHIRSDDPWLNSGKRLENTTTFSRVVEGVQKARRK